MLQRERGVRELRKTQNIRKKRDVRQVGQKDRWMVLKKRERETREGVRGS
jgi:hypothetical protein